MKKKPENSADQATASTSVSVEKTPQTLATTSVVGKAAPGKASSKTALAQFRRTWRTLTPRRRLDAILDAPDPIRVVRSIPVQDLFATVREVGAGDCLEVMEMLHPRQVQGFVDLDGWRRDRIDPAAIGEWFEVLFAANPMRAATQIRGLDIELISLLFKVHTRVYDLHGGEDAPEDDLGLHTTTPDQRYLIVYDHSSASEKLIHGLKGAIDLLMGKDMTFVLRLCEAVRWELPSALEEESYRFRNSRLADIGLLDAGEVHSVFAFTNPDGAPVGTPVSPPVGQDVDDGESTDLSTSVLLPWELLQPGATILSRALENVDETTSRRVAHELMLCTNRVHLADGGDLGDPLALKDTARRVLDTVGIALSYRTRGEVTALAATLSGASIPWLFRVGNSIGLRMQGEFKARLAAKENGLGGHALLRLDTPLREAVAGILRKRPLFYGGLDDANRVDFVPFTTLPEVAETARALSEAAFRAAITGPRGLGTTDVVIEACAADPGGPSMAMIVGSALVRNMDGDALTCAPLDDEALQKLSAAVKASPFDDGRRQRAIDSFVELARGIAPLPGAATVDEAETRARAYASHVLRSIEDEFQNIQTDVDARFVSSVWTLENGAAKAEPEQEVDDDERESRSRDDGDDIAYPHGNDLDGDLESSVALFYQRTHDEEV